MFSAINNTHMKGSYVKKALYNSYRRLHRFLLRN